VSACPKCRFPVTFGGGSNCRPDNEEIKSIKKHGKMKSATRRLTLHLLVIESVALTCRKYVNYLEME
jgi:hypothetical protein